jgi:hypothetical protein
MRAYKTNRDNLDRTNSASAAADTRSSSPRLARVLNASGRPGHQRCFALSTQAPLTPWAASRVYLPPRVISSKQCLRSCGQS